MYRILTSTYYKNDKENTDPSVGDVSQINNYVFTKQNFI